MNTLSDDERAAGWQLLFDGQTTQGWRGFGQSTMPREWQAVDGALVLTTRAAAGAPGKLGTGIVTSEPWDDFELALEWKLAPGGNSGIFYRVGEEEARPHHTGPEMQILDNVRHPDAQNGLERTAGACYGLYAPSKDVTKPVGQWNTVRIVVDGDRVEHRMNNKTIVAYQLGSADWQNRVQNSKFKEMPRYGRLSKGHILLQDHEHYVAYRNLKIRRLSGKDA